MHVAPSDGKRQARACTRVRGPGLGPGPRGDFFRLTLLLEWAASVFADLDDTPAPLLGGRPLLQQIPVPRVQHREERLVTEAEYLRRKDRERNDPGI